jgi:hypothetical protein
MTGVANGVKVAVTFRACVIPTVHVLVPLHPSKLQPVKLESLAALAVNVTLVPKSKGALHVLPQLSPTGLLVTVPPPVPAFTTVRGNCWSVKVALTVRAWIILTVHVLVPLHPSKLQPVKLESLAALAVNVTLVPCSKAALVAIHVLSQLSPAGLEVTVPLPVPAFTTVSVN